MNQNWKITYSPDGKTDYKKLKSKSAAIQQKFFHFQSILTENPYSLQSYGKHADFPGCRCIRLNKQDRLIYKIFESEKIVRIVSIFGHYND